MTPALPPRPKALSAAFSQNSQPSEGRGGRLRPPPPCLGVGRGQALLREPLQRPAVLSEGCSPPSHSGVAPHAGRGRSLPPGCPTSPRGRAPCLPQGHKALQDEMRVSGLRGTAVCHVEGLGLPSPGLQGELILTGNPQALIRPPIVGPSTGSRDPRP